VRTIPVANYSGYPTLPANVCPFSGCGELSGFVEDFAETAGESAETTAGSFVRQGGTKHLEHMLSSAQGIEHPMIVIS
jgi:hypothetical protein